MIEFVQDFHPFSHIPGTRVLLPGSSYVVEPFPALFRVYSLSSELMAEVHFSGVGPLKQFTITQDIERSKVSVSGMSRGGFFHYEIGANANSIILRKRKIPDGCQVHVTSSSLSVVQTDDSFPPKTLHTRLLLGCYKKQDWDDIVRRLDMSEILPFWFLMAQGFSHSRDYEEGTLVADLHSAIRKQDCLKVVPLLTDIFTTGFSGMFVPQTVDTKHLGYERPSFTRGKKAPLELLQLSFPLLQSLFFVEDGYSWHILPAVPPEFHCGMLVHIRTKKTTVSIEWTKKWIRRVFIDVHEKGDAQIRFPAKVDCFRFREFKGKNFGRMFNNSSLLLNEKTRYVCDQFER